MVTYEQIRRIESDILNNNNFYYFSSISEDLVMELLKLFKKYNIDGEDISAIIFEIAEEIEWQIGEYLSGLPLSYQPAEV